jgi:hypothetical protein
MPTPPVYPTDLYSNIRTKIQLVRGIYELVLILVNDGLNVDMPGEEYTEAMERGEHLARPILIKTKDVDITGSGSFRVASFTSTTGAYTPLEFLKRIGRGSGLPSAIQTGRDNIEIRQYSWSEGSSETMILSPCVITNIGFNPKGDGDIGTITFDYVCHAKEPIIVQGEVLV